MATISTGGGEGGKKTVDHEIPLIPFIDLLLCCVMFLLVTAVWNKLASVDASLPANGPTEMGGEADVRLATLRVGSDGYHIVGTAGDEIHVARSESAYDTSGLREQLATRRRIDPNEHAMMVTADDGVAYAELVLAMDVLTGSGYRDVTITGAP
jgi:biopolymer transport protein ExbD